ncbi:MAG: hypothetical protein K0U68_13940 [Gammaproteobacteria bacterium]|nr:hypothetical protein [Gammaproteobacteria bacterium]
MLDDHFNYSERVKSIRGLFVLRGMLMMIIGAIFTFLSVFNPDIGILNSYTAWLPLAAILLIILSLTVIFDAFLSSGEEAFLIHANLAITDILLSIIILAELHKDVTMLALLIAFYLMTRGMFRIISAIKIRFTYSRHVIISGVIGFLLGALMWAQSNTIDIQMISILLCLELTIRGWSLYLFGIWIRKTKKQKQNQHGLNLYDENS